MKEGFLLVVVVAVLGGGVWYFTKTSAPGAAQASGSSAKPSPAKEAPASSTRSVSHPKRSNPVKSFDEVEPTVPAIIVNVPAEEPAAVIAEKSLPSLSALQGALDRDDLRERLGNPALKASSVDRGAFYETYVYQHRTGSPVIVAYLRDGKLQTVRAGH